MVEVDSVNVVIKVLVWVDCLFVDEGVWVKVG